MGATAWTVLMRIVLVVTNGGRAGVTMALYRAGERSGCASRRSWVQALHRVAHLTWCLNRGPEARCGC